MNLFFDATESSKAKSTLARLRLVGALAGVRKDILALGAGAGNIVQRLQLVKEALSLREQLGALDVPNGDGSDADTDREAILVVFNQLGRDYPDRSMSVAGDLAGSVEALIQEAVGRKMMPEELKQLVSMEERRAAYREGQQAVDPVASAVVAMRDVIEAQADAPAAVRRDDLGAVDFIWGDEGKPPTASGKRKGAKGVAHILEARMRKDGLTLEEAAAVAEEVARVVALGEITLTHHHQDVSQATITDGQYSAILVKREGSNAWLLTGWEENKDSDETGKGDDKTSSTHSRPTPARPEAGAESSDINIAQAKPEDERLAQQIAEEMAPDEIRAEIDQLSALAEIRMAEAVETNGADALPAPIDYLDEHERDRLNLLKNALPSFAQERDEARQRLEQRASERKAGRGQAAETVVTANNVSVDVPVIDQSLIDDYNRTTHVFGGRDFNAELRSEAESLLNELAERKHTLDAPEQQALAKELIESYLQAQAEFAQWNARFSTSNPSWIVTGRSGRNMEKYNRANERHMDEYTKRVERLQAQRKSVGEVLYSKRPQEVKDGQALTKERKLITRYVADIAEWLEKDAMAMAVETRKWATPKAYKHVMAALDMDREATIQHLREMDSSATSQKHGGLVKILGPRSKAGKLIEALLNESE